MRRILSIILCLTMLMTCASLYVFAEDVDTTGMALTVEKYTRPAIDEDGTIYTTRPYTIRAVYDSGATDLTVDKFVKKSWVRVDVLDEAAQHKRQSAC